VDRRDPQRQTAMPLVPRPAAASWQEFQTAILMIADALALTAAMVLASLFRFGVVSEQIDNIGYSGIGALIVGIWMLLLARSGAYDPKFLGTGTEEFKRVTSATIQTFAVTAVVAYMFQIVIARGYIAIALALGFAALSLVRWLLRKELQSARRAGKALHRVVLVGDRHRVLELARQLRADPNAGFGLVGACLPNPGEKLRAEDEIPVLGTFADVAEAVRNSGADTVAVTSGTDLGSNEVREIAWSLEGMPVDLVVAPTLTDIAGPRITMRPVAGLPLIYVEEPEFTGYRRVAKRTLDVVASGLGLLLLSPVLITIAVVIRLTSPGPALFTQLRVGKEGDAFKVYKFRTMRPGAQAEQEQVWASGDGNNKVKADPRVTGIGKHLRRWSLDELPQLFNVFGGSMSLVGPRPMQPVEVDDLPGRDLRRHLSKPGITGLWQVSGRSDTTWDERMRLDLYYVENWSLSLDIAILLRTMAAVVKGSGAY
jgi:exopolysaccharide biosynthesis polyprenyl glycosylphosphotransferase